MELGVKLSKLRGEVVDSNNYQIIIESLRYLAFYMGGIVFT
jgi:hypothetical protein